MTRLDGEETLEWPLGWDRVRGLGLRMTRLWNVPDLLWHNVWVRMSTRVHTHVDRCLTARVSDLIRVRVWDLVNDRARTHLRRAR